MAQSTKEAALRDRQTSAEVRARTVLDVLSGQQTVADAATELGVTRQTIYNWRSAFLAAGSASLGEPGDRVERLSADCAARTEAVVVAIVERLRRLHATRELDMPTLEAIRSGAGLPVNRFCELAGIPRRTYYARRATAGDARAAPAREAVRDVLSELGRAHPDWGARRMWRHLSAVGGPDVSLATVKRALASRS